MQNQRPVIVIEGAQKTIRPQVTGQPTPSFDWLSPSGSLIPVRGSNSDPNILDVRELIETQRVTVDENGSLVINRAAVEDSGIYTCKATNVAGTLSFTVDVSVQKKEEATTVSMTTPTLRDNVYGKRNEQTAVETEDGVLKECFNSHGMMVKVVSFSCLITFLLTSLFLVLIFCCYQKRAATRTKTFFGQFEPIPERHRMGFGFKSTFESGSSLRTALTRLSTLSFGSDIEYAPGTTNKRSQMNNYYTGSETMVRQFSLSSQTGKHTNGDEGNCATYEHPYAATQSKTCELPNPPEQEEMEGYMIPMEAKSNTIIPTKKNQNSTVCTFDPNYATIDPIALRHA